MEGGSINQTMLRVLVMLVDADGMLAPEHWAATVPTHEWKRLRDMAIEEDGVLTTDEDMQWLLSKVGHELGVTPLGPTERPWRDKIRGQSAVFRGRAPQAFYCVRFRRDG